ncbi:MAG: M20/M25/M40 family metallo-hydrolase [Lachnospiraceae bacterium]|nr:M20/M25/M40 family metallo-hydrolase [Lachnospiraceae bacterium]
MNSYKERIDAYIDGKKDEMLQDLMTLVRIDSQKGEASEGKPFGEGPAAVIAAAQGMMESYGLKVRNYENYVVAGDLIPAADGTYDCQAKDAKSGADGTSDDVVKGASAEASDDSWKGLDILAHLDVVPVTEDWTVTQPFEPKIVDGRIYGRGTSADNGPATAAMYALRAIRELGIPMKKGVRLVLGSDEECGSGDLRYYYGIEKEAPYTFTPDADFPVINIEKGRFAPTFTAEFAPESDGCPRILSLKSGDKANVVPARASLVLEGLEEETVRMAAAETEAETGVTFEIQSGSLTGQNECETNGQISESASMAQNQPGAKILRIQARGQAAHASTPQEGKNALTAALRLVSKLAQDTSSANGGNGVNGANGVNDANGANNAKRDIGKLGAALGESSGLSALLALERLFPYEDTCGKSVGIYREEAQSGAVTLCFSILDYTPEHLSGTFDSRLPIGCTEENTKRVVMDALAKAGIQLEDHPMSRPHCVPGDSDFVKILLDSYEDYTGVRGEPLSTGGGTYVHNLERGVAFGCMTPDVDNHMHGDDEFMVIERLLTSAKIFAEAAIRICNEL